MLIATWFKVGYFSSHTDKVIILFYYLDDNLLEFLKKHCTYTYISHTRSRLTIVSREAKKKQAVHDERVSYLYVAPL